MRGSGTLLVAEMRDRDAMRAPGLNPCLDDGTDVVCVHVDVPEVLPADDQDRVTQPIEANTKPGHRFLVAVREQVHDLICRCTRLPGRAPAPVVAMGRGPQR